MPGISRCMPSRRARAALAVSVVLSVCMAARADEPVERPEPMPSRWMAPDKTPRPLHPVPKLSGPLKIRRVDPQRGVKGGLPPVPGVKGRICLVVEDGIYDSMSTRLTRYVQDLEADGYTVLTYRFVSGSAEDLRAYFIGLYNEPASLAAAQFLGDVPYIVYEMMQDWDGSGGDPPEYEDFPCDLFFMDMNGTWSDTLEDGSVHAGNGKYDTWTGDRDLEIWVSRLRTGNLGSLGSGVNVLNNYFDKNHAYRQRVLAPPGSSLVYDDDDWQHRGTEDGGYHQSVYGAGAVTVVSAPESTTASDYKAVRMPVDQELILTRSHGWPGGHGYYRNNRSTFERVYTSDYRAIDPPALFYSFFVCSGCDYTASDYLGGTAAFNADSGLLAWGSTKTGGILWQSALYQALSSGDCFGVGFKNWFNGVDHYSYAPRWWYGMVLIGDASLCTSPQWFTLTVSLPASASEGDGLLPGQGTVSIPWALEANLVVSLSSDDPSELAVPVSVTVSAGQTSAPFDLTMVDDALLDGSQPATVAASASGWTGAADTMTVTDNDRTLDVASVYGMADPPVGQHVLPAGMTTCRITTSPAVFQDAQSWKSCICTGWVGTGSVPASGTGIEVTFPLNEDSSITWKWAVEDLVVSNQTVAIPTNYHVLNTITTGDGYRVEPPGDVTLEAGTEIRLTDGTTLSSGSEVRATVPPP